MFALLLAALLPTWEMKTVQEVAKDYGLSKEQTALMVAIRRAENGIKPYYFGVANRRCNTYLKQAQWTANTIRKRYDGNLNRFGNRWCPTETSTWLKNVRFFMRKQGFHK